MFDQEQKKKSRFKWGMLLLLLLPIAFVTALLLSPQYKKPQGFEALDPETKGEILATIDRG